MVGTSSPATFGETPPGEIRLSAGKNLLTVVFAPQAFTFTAEFLRVQSPSAEVQGHGRKVLVAGKKGVTITKVEAVGHYAVRLVFSDGHATGLYTWEYFKTMGEKQFDLWADYTQTLHAQGLSR